MHGLPSLELDRCIGTPIYIGRCCRCIASAKFRRYISAKFAHKSVALLLCMERSETQAATSSLTLID